MIQVKLLIWKSPGKLASSMLTLMSLHAIAREVRDSPKSSARGQYRNGIRHWEKAQLFWTFVSEPFGSLWDSTASQRRLRSSCYMTSSTSFWYSWMALQFATSPSSPHFVVVDIVPRAFHLSHAWIKRWLADVTGDLSDGPPRMQRFWNRRCSKCCMFLDFLSDCLISCHKSLMKHVINEPLSLFIKSWDLSIRKERVVWEYRSTRYFRKDSFVVKSRSSFNDGKDVRVKRSMMAPSPFCWLLKGCNCPIHDNNFKFVFCYFVR
jgi:hypothetical protein